LFYGAERERPVIERLADTLPEHIIPVEVEETGSIGMDVWFAALAYGAARIYILVAPESPASVVREVITQLSFAHAILDGMGYSSDSLTLITKFDEGSVLAAFADSEGALPEGFAQFAALNEKRRTIRFAVGHLFEKAPESRPLISLPAGAPFGDVQVDTIRCTLCMACVSQCPAGALEAGDELPQLKFIEDNCVQCGICCRTCPEDAISISPRYLFDAEQRRRRRVINEDKPFHCITCGKVFGSHSIIEQMSRKLQTHPMFQGAAAQRLRMCEDCRVKDMF
jgi:ferredoxin